MPAWIWLKDYSLEYRHMISNEATKYWSESVIFFNLFLYRDVK